MIFLQSECNDCFLFQHQEPFNSVSFFLRGLGDWESIWQLQTLSLSLILTGILIMTYRCSVHKHKLDSKTGLDPILYPVMIILPVLTFVSNNCFGRIYSMCVSINEMKI